jgi:peptidyl-prolyl cis-trans isomerase B (cyclophilin B)
MKLWFKRLFMGLLVGLPLAVQAERPKVTEPTAPKTFPEGKKVVVVMVTSKGTIEAELFAREAPLSVTNFVQLVEKGYYSGLTFHRVVPGFVVQGGDPEGTGTGGPGYTVKAEIGLKHAQGAWAWARTSDQVNPERRSSGSQFYIALEALPSLDGQYTVFGQTIKGFDVVQKIAMSDTIQSAKIEYR